MTTCKNGLIWRHMKTLYVHVFLLSVNHVMTRVTSDACPNICVTVLDHTCSPKHWFNPTWLLHVPIRWYSETSSCMQTSHCIWHWFQTNWTYHFSPRYFNGIKIVTALKCIFEETMPKLSVNFGNHISQDSHKNQYPGPVCNFGSAAPQYGDECWSNL